MRILIVTQYFWPEAFVVNSLATELQSRGHQVTVFTALPNYPKGRFYDSYSFFTGPFSEKYHDVNVVRVPILARGQNGVRLAINYLSFVISGILFSFRKPKDIDVIFCFGLSPVILCLPAIFIKWLTRKPLVFWVQDLWPESVSAVGAKGAGLITAIIGPIVRFIYTRCDLILTQSKAFKTSILKYGGDENKISYVPNWADPFVEGAESEWIKNLPEGFKIGFAGNIGKAQDMKTLLQAAELLRSHKDIQWIVAGDGSEKQWLDLQIVERQLSQCIKTVGKKSYNDMLPFFKKCDALYVSLTDQHIFSLTIPSKVQAYMSSGKPLLCCLNGEGARVIDEAGCGLIANAEDAKKLAENILTLKNKTYEERQQMGQNGFQFFQRNFERSLVIDQIENLIKNSTVGNKA